MRHMTLGTKLLLILSSMFALALLLGGSFLAEAKRPRQGADAGAASGTPSAAGACKKDKDCALVPDDCCTCNEGGKQRAIPAAQKDAYETERKKRCAGTMCPQMMSQDPSCTQKPVCSQGTCSLPATPTAPRPSNSTP